MSDEPEPYRAPALPALDVRYTLSLRERALLLFAFGPTWLPVAILGYAGVMLVYALVVTGAKVANGSPLPILWLVVGGGIAVGFAYGMWAARGLVVRLGLDDDGLQVTYTWTPTREATVRRPWNGLAARDLGAAFVLRLGAGGWVIVPRRAFEGGNSSVFEAWLAARRVPITRVRVPSLTKPLVVAACIGLFVLVYHCKGAMNDAATDEPGAAPASERQP